MNAIRTILGGWISQGPNVKSFEDRYSSYIGTKHGIAVNSGSFCKPSSSFSVKNAIIFLMEPR